VPAAANAVSGNSFSCCWCSGPVFYVWHLLASTCVLFMFRLHVAVVTRPVRQLQCCWSSATTSTNSLIPLLYWECLKMLQEVLQLPLKH
jgi:hypothetical protein